MNRREFHLVEGTSSKFWAVSIDNTTMTVQYGKIGTAGQTQLKSFGSTAEAQQAAEKLISEKARKGYIEAAPATPPPAPKATKAPPAPKASTATPPTAAIERRLNLAPEDWLRARGPERSATPLPAEEPERPFDFAALKNQAHEFYSRPDFKLPDVVTGQEARFWLYLSTNLTSLDYYSREKAINKLTAKPFEKPFPLAQVKANFEKMYFDSRSLPILRLQRSWMSPVDLIEATAYHPVVRLAGYNASEMAGWLETVVFPRLDDAAMNAVRDCLRRLINGEDRTTAFAAAILARHAGLDAEILTLAGKLKKTDFPAKETWAGWSAVLFGIKDLDRLVKEFRRVGARLSNPGDARVWLALTGHSALDVLRDSILAMRKADDLLAMLDVLLLAESPEAAVALLEVKLAAKPPEAASKINAWLKTHRVHAVAGLSPLTSENTARGEAARSLIDGAKSSEGGPPPDRPPADASPTDLSWLRTALDGVKVAKTLPAYAAPSQLPPIHSLGDEDVSRVVTALAASTLAAPHPLIGALRRHGDRPALAAFAWALFEGWRDAGTPPKEKWTLIGLGHLGDDGVVMKLAPLIRAWPGESQHQRAVTGLEVLRLIGTDMALMQLNGMALKLKFKALQQRARELMDAIAADRGLTREQLEDRIVPDLGLDADGSRTFDFGPRSFRFTLGADLSLAVADESGKPLKDLPKPGVKDDAEKASAAVAEWKLLKGQLREALKVQTMRLEEAMIAGRAWPRAEFETLLVGHPFLTNLVRRLVWAGRGSAGEVVCHFRPDEKGEWINHDGRPVARENVTEIRLAHRLQMTAGQVESWRVGIDRLGIDPPFPQIRRPVYTAEGEENLTVFVRPAGQIPATKARGTLEERGWRRVMHDQGGIVGFAKPYPAAGVTGVVMVNPCILIGMMDNSPVEVREVFFVRGIECPHGPCSDGYYEGRGRLALGEVDAVAYSETVRDLLSLMPPGK